MQPRRSNPPREQPMSESDPVPFDELPESRPQNRGWFRKGQPGPALKHGGRSALVQAGRLPAQAEVNAMLAEREAVIIADIGGVDVLSVLGVDEVKRYTRLELVYDYALGKLLDGGPFTA